MGDGFAQNNPRGSCVTTSMVAPRIRTMNAAGAIASTLADDLRDLLGNRLAFVGGLGGLSLSALAFFGATQWKAMDGEGEDAAEIDPAFELEFAPGTLARLGEPIDPTLLPQKIIIKDARAPEPPPPTTQPAAVSRDEQADAAKPTADPTPPAKPAPRDDRSTKLPIAPKPTHKNTPYDRDIPTVDHDIGKAFGDAEGWDELTRDGDAWATEVMKRLANMPVGWYAGDAAPGEFRFLIDVCKDGTIGKVLDKGGTMSPDGRRAVALALDMLELPKPSRELAASMPSECARIRHTFVWSGAKVR